MSEQQTYKKTEWKNDETHLNASNLNNMEYGIDLSVRTSSQNARNIQDHDDKINILNGTEETEGSVKKAVKDAKKEIIGDYSEDFTGNKQQTIASTVEYFQGEVNSLNDEIDAQSKALQDNIDAANKSINDKAKELQDNINTLSNNSSINFNAHVDNKNNPHEVTATQLNVYTKDQTFTKNEVKNEIALSGGGGGSVNVDTTMNLIIRSSNMLPYQIDLSNISNILPQNIFITVKVKDGFEDQDPSGIISVFGDSLIEIIKHNVEYAGTYTFTLNKKPLRVTYTPSYLSGIEYKDWGNYDYLDITVSYLTEGGVEKLFDYIDITALTKLDTLISSGTADPDETITSQYYFKYSE